MGDWDEDSGSPMRSGDLKLGPGTEWGFRHLAVDLNGVATARLVRPSLHIWLGDSTGGLTPVKPTWTDIGYAALATGEINRDGFPGIVAASYFGLQPPGRSWPLLVQE